MARGKKKKTRTHVAKDTSAAPSKSTNPKSFVVKSGEVGTSVSALVRDVRRVLEPNTASRLKERKRNRVKDYIAMSGPLGVTHLLIFSQTEAESEILTSDNNDLASNVNFRISRLPRGPSLGFKVLRYALAKDVLAASKRPHSPGREYSTEPILVLNNFSGEEQHLKLMTTIFQNLFPPIHVHTMALTEARRVVLLSYNSTTRTIDFRHYLISVRPVGVSRSIRKIVEGASNRSRTSTPSTSRSASKSLPNLSNAGDISDYVLAHADLGFVTSASEAEDSDAEGVRQVDLAADYVGRGNKKNEKRAVRLTELGPRMELGLVKIEEGIGEGDVLFHQFVHKSTKEAAELARKAAAKRKLTAERRAEQKANVDAKKAAREEKKQAKAARKATAEGTDQPEKSGSESDESEDEFEYEDLFADQEPEEDEEDMFGDEDEMLEEDSEEEEDDMAQESSASEDEAPKPTKASKRAKR